MQSVFYIDVNPILFKIGPFSVSWYGVMVALAVFALIGWIVWQTRKNQFISQDQIYTVALVGIVSGIVFSKMLHVVDLWSYYVHNPGKIISGEGLTIWGAVLGATLGIWIYGMVSKKFKLGLFLDTLAPGAILAMAIGRIGCTLNGCCYGLETDSCLAVVYQDPHSYAPLGIPVLPTQIFEIGYDLILFGVLFALRGKLKPEGSLFLVFFAMYGAWRFGIEFIREGTPFLFGMHQAQFIGLLVMLITVPMIIIRTRWISKDQVEAVQN